MPLRQKLAWLTALAVAFGWLLAGTSVLAGGEDDRGVRTGLAEAVGARPVPLQIGTPAVDTANVRGREMRTPEGTIVSLDREPSNELMGTLSPRVVPVGDGTFVYTSWKTVKEDDPTLAWSEQNIEPGTVLGVPQLWRTAESGRDVLIADGAYSAAAHRDGRLAYAKGLVAEYRAGEPYDTTVEVLAADGTRQTLVGEPGSYVVAAWAADTLLVYELDESSGAMALIAIDAEGPRELAKGYELGGLDATGERAILVSTAGVDSANAADYLQIVRIADGAVLNRMGAIPLANAGARWLSTPGDWQGDRIVLGGSPGPVTLSIRGESLQLDEVISIAAEHGSPGVVAAAFGTSGAIDALVVDPEPGSGGKGQVRSYQARIARCDAEGCVLGDPSNARNVAFTQNRSRGGSR